MLVLKCTNNSIKKDDNKSLAGEELISHEPHLSPAWLKEEPIVFVGNWDSEFLFSHRRGGDPVWQIENYEKQHTDEAVRKLKEIGVTMAVIHFYKGFGLEAEKEHMNDARILADLCKKYGIKVGVYIGSSVGYETFLLEKPEAEDWFVPDYLGIPVRYGGGQTFRKRVYFMHPGFIDYMKKVVKIAINELKVDLIHFDNTSGRAHPSIFHHPLAVANFKTYLTNKYTPDERKKRFGFSEMKYVEPPKYDHPLSVINDPLFQEWTDFRCQQLADFYGIMERFIRSLNPEVAVENNPHSGMSGNNTMWDQGVDYPRLLAHTDIVWTEEGNDASVNEDGILISKIRSYKMASTLKNKIFTYTSRSLLQMAEAMAYNRQCIGMVGSGLAGYQLPDKQKEYIKFYHKNFEYYRGIYNVADVAVLHSYATMAFNNDGPYQSTFLFEQSLIQEKIPFDIIFDDNLNDLSKYKVLVLADQECLTEEQLDLIRNFVKNGGGLVATGNTSLYTEWRQRKKDFGLNDLFQFPEPEGGIRRHFSDIKLTQKQTGLGKVVYIPAVRAAIPKTSAVAMTSRYWKLPVNTKELIESVKWASGNHLTLLMEAPQNVTMELMKKDDNSSMILHLINYDIKNPAIKNIKVDVQIPEGKKVTKITVKTPDGRNEEQLLYRENSDRITFTVPQLSIYNLVIIKLE